MAIGIAGLYGASAVAGVVSGGPLDPPDVPNPSMLRLDELPPAWHQVLPSSSRGGDPCDSARFDCVMSDQAVLDRETGLVWERAPVPCAVSCAWTNGLTQCVKSEVGGRRGWRLPHIEELQSLIDPANDMLPSPNPFTVTDGYYWSATTSFTSATDAMYLDVASGVAQPSALAKSDNGGRSWCVRGGHNGDAP